MKFELLMLCRRVARRVERLDDHLGRPGVGKPDANAGDRSLPSRQAIDGDHRARFDDIGVEFPAAAAHGHVAVRLPAARGR